MTILVIVLRQFAIATRRCFLLLGLVPFFLFVLQCMLHVLQQLLGAVSVWVVSAEQAFLD